MQFRRFLYIAAVLFLKTDLDMMCFFFEGNAIDSFTGVKNAD